MEDPPSQMTKGGGVKVANLAPLVLLFMSLEYAPARAVDLQSVPELKAAMYTDVDHWPCVRLATLAGEVGCANPGRHLVSAPLQRLQSGQEKVTEYRAILLGPEIFPEFLKRTLADAQLASNVAGVLLEADSLLSNTSRSLPPSSPAARFPQSEFARLEDRQYVWNPFGVDVLNKRFNFPVVMLDANSTRQLRGLAERNADGKYQHPLHVAEFNFVMDITARETQNSADCLAAGNCLPLGGYSVLSSFHPLNSTVPSKLPLVLVTASLDAQSFFRDFAPGAEHPLSGAIALLAAMDALSSAPLPSHPTRQLAFVFFVGEGWGYIGSRRFIAEVERGAPWVDGIDLSILEAFLEVGPVGRCGNNTFFVHKSKGQAVQVTDSLVDLLREAESGVLVSRASSGNPGLPPGAALSSFVERNASTPGVYLADFDTAFKNPYYASVFDDRGNIDLGSIEAAGTLLARALQNLTGGGSHNSLLKLNSSLVTALVDCFLTTDPGVSCPLVQELITPAETGFPGHYVGIIRRSPTGGVLSASDTTARFVWNFMANRTARKGSSKAPCQGHCDVEGEVCTGWTVRSLGQCLLSSTQYVPAYSTRLNWDDKGWHIIPTPAGLPADPDPVWTESNWNKIGLRVYLQDSPNMERKVLLAGVLVTLLTLAVQYTASAYLCRRVKQL